MNEVTDDGAGMGDDPNVDEITYVHLVKVNTGSE